MSGVFDIEFIFKEIEDCFGERSLSEEDFLLEIHEFIVPIFLNSSHQFQAPSEEWIEEILGQGALISQS